MKINEKVAGVGPLKLLSRYTSHLTIRHVLAALFARYVVCNLMQPYADAFLRDNLRTIWGYSRREWEKKIVFGGPYNLFSRLQEQTV